MGPRRQGDRAVLVASSEAAGAIWVGARRQDIRDSLASAWTWLRTTRGLVEAKELAAACPSDGAAEGRASALGAREPAIGNGREQVHAKATRLCGLVGLCAKPLSFPIRQQHVDAGAWTKSSHEAHENT